MNTVLYLASLFFAKVLDNMFATSKTLLVQRNKSILAGVALGLSNYIYLTIIKNVVAADGNREAIIVSVGAGVGCCLAVAISNKLSKEHTYVNVIMSDNKDAMMDFRDFLMKHKITNEATDSYTKDWSKKSLTITAYAETKADSRLIDQYIENSDLKFKRIVQGKRK